MREAEKRNAELGREIRALQRIQAEQGKALARLAGDNDYIARIQGLVEEVKAAKDRMRELEERQRREDKVQKGQHEQAAKWQEKCKELKNMTDNAGKYNVNKDVGEGDKDLLIVEMLERLKELEHSREVVEKAKELEVRSGQAMRKKHGQKMREVQA